MSYSVRKKLVPQISPKLCLKDKVYFNLFVFIASSFAKTFDPDLLCEEFQGSVAVLIGSNEFIFHSILHFTMQ